MVRIIRRNWPLFLILGIFVSLLTLAAVQITGLSPARAEAPKRHKTPFATTHWKPVVRPKTPNVPAGYKRNNKIDNFIIAQWVENEVSSAANCSDAIFCRRVYLDLVGRIPTAEEAVGFLNDRKKGTRRKRLIDKLLDTDEYARHWSKWWGDLLRVQSRDFKVKNNAWRDWVRESLAYNKPYDEFVSEMITATGGTDTNGAVHYVLRDNAKPEELTIATSQVFLATNLKCAQCHDHPYEDWTMNDFYGMAAFFARIGIQRQDPEKVKAFKEGRLSVPYNRPQAAASAGSGTESKKASGSGTEPKSRASTGNRSGSGGRTMTAAERRAAARRGRGGSSGRLTRADINRLTQLDYYRVYDRKRGEIRVKRLDGSPKPIARPRFITGVAPKIAKGEDRRRIFARLLTAKDNPLFARVYVNRVWKKLLGVGLVEPVDDFSEGNDPSHPGLLDYLASEFIEHDYDMKQMIRLVANSRAYQLASEAKPRVVASDPGNDYFSRQHLRRMNAEQIYDSILAATGLAVAPKQPASAPRGGMRRRGQGPRRMAPPGAKIEATAYDVRDPAPFNHFLFTFGSHSRESIYERVNEASIPQALALLNGDLTNQGSLARPGSPLDKWMSANWGARRVAQQMYLQTLSRLPTAAEASIAVAHIANGRNGAEDVMWALLNTREFMFIK